MSEKKRILIVDDEPDFLATTSTRLSFEGFETQTAENGEWALELLKKGELPDLILLDIMMPGLTGVQLYERLRRDPRTASVPIIFLTVWEQLLPSVFLSDAKCRLLRKPFDLDVLIDEIKKLTAGSEG
jgi:CheY-like chemotaxis protein